MRRFFEAYALNTSGVMDPMSLVNATGIARSTGAVYEQLQHKTW